MENQIDIPLVMMGKSEGGIVVLLARDPEFGDSETVETFSYLACELVRNIAACFKIEEEVVWAVVEKMRKEPKEAIRTLYRSEDN